MSAKTKDTQIFGHCDVVLSTSKLGSRSIQRCYSRFESGIGRSMLDYSHSFCSVCRLSFGWDGFSLSLPYDLRSNIYGCIRVAGILFTNGLTHKNADKILHNFIELRPAKTNTYMYILCWKKKILLDLEDIMYRRKSTPSDTSVRLFSRLIRKTILILLEALTLQMN